MATASAYIAPNGIARPASAPTAVSQRPQAGAGSAPFALARASDAVASTRLKALALPALLLDRRLSMFLGTRAQHLVVMDQIVQRILDLVALGWYAHVTPEVILYCIEEFLTMVLDIDGEMVRVAEALSEPTSPAEQAAVDARLLGMLSEHLFKCWATERQIATRIHEAGQEATAVYHAWLLAGAGRPAWPGIGHAYSSLLEHTLNVCLGYDPRIQLGWLALQTDNEVARRRLRDEIAKQLIGLHEKATAPWGTAIPLLSPSRPPSVPQPQPQHVRPPRPVPSSIAAAAPRRPSSSARVSR